MARWRYVVFSTNFLDNHRVTLQSPTASRRSPDVPLPTTAPAFTAQLQKDTDPQMEKDTAPPMDLSDRPLSLAQLTIDSGISSSSHLPAQTPSLQASKDSLSAPSDQQTQDGAASPQLIDDGKWERALSFRIPYLRIRSYRRC